MQWTTDKQRLREAYNNDGFVIVRGLFDADKVLELQRQLQRYVRYVVPRLPPMDAFFEDKDARQQIRMLSRMERHDQYFNELLTSGSLIEIATNLCGGSVVPHDAAYFNKLPLIGDATPPHQDGFYFHLEPCVALTLWVALDQVDQDNGCIYYVRGSHRRGMREHGRTDVLGFSQGIVDYGMQHDVDNEVAACVSPGDTIIHNALTIHRTDTNQSPRPRRALGFVYFSNHAKVDRSGSAEYQNQLANDWQTKGKI